MSSRHRFPAFTVRPEPALYRRAKTAVAEVDSDINAHVIGFLEWLVGDTDQLPARPLPTRAAAGTAGSETSAS